MSWQRVRGHDLLVKAFARVASRGRLAHAYLFTGPEGVGKRLFAGELAKALLCEDRPASRLEACDHCPACHQVEAGTHPDLFTAARPEESLELGIEVVRELCKNLALKPARGRSKIAILDDANDINSDAANCFLKTLEEPPPGSILLLIGTSAERQLPTLLSRCQIVRFAPLPESLVADLLRSQGVDDPAQVQRLARLSNGSPGQALALADPALWQFRRTLLDGLLQPRANSVALAQEWTHFVEEAGKESASQRRRAALVLRFLIEFFNDALRFGVGMSPKLGEPEDLQLLRKFVELVEPEKIVELLERCLEGDVQIDRRVQLVLVLEALVDVLGRSFAA